LSDTPSLEQFSPAERLTQKIKEHAGSNWIHDFEVRADKQIWSPENYAYRRRILEGLFATMLLDSSVLVLDEASGVYPALIARAGARSVAACSASDSTCELMTELWEFLDVRATALNSRMVAFYDSEPYVEMQYGDSFEFVVVLNQIWPMFNAAGQSFDALVEACAFPVTEGAVFDWTDAEWAKPAPPPEYNSAAFCDALRKKFEYVTQYSDWLIVAVGKLPAESDEPGQPTP